MTIKAREKTDKGDMEKPLYTGHRQRMRDKLLTFGGRFFESYELLEMLLYSVIPYKDTKPIAKRLLLKFGDIQGVFDASFEELTNVDGVGKRCAEFLVLAGRVMKAGEIAFANKPADVYDDYNRAGKFFTGFFRENTDAKIALMLLDGYMRFISVHDIPGGSFGSGGVKPESFIKPALSARAEVAMLAYTHNHGPLFPSEADRETGKMVFDELKSLGIVLAEQYIVCGDTYLGVGAGVSLRLSTAPELSNFAKSKEISHSQKAVVDMDGSVYTSAGEYLTEYLYSILSFVMKTDKARAVALNLCAKFGNIDRLLSSDIGEIESVEGMSRSTALFIKLLGYMASRAVTDSFASGTDYSEEELHEYVKAHFIGLDRETVYLLSLDEKDRIISCNYVGEGTVNGSDVYPRRLLEVAVDAKASSVIMAHNHPSSGCEPSRDDIMATEGLSAFFNSAGIRLKAHLVVSGREHNVITPVENKRN